MKTTTAKVDAFVTLGSAGLKYGTTAADLQALSGAKGTKIFATHAEGDGIAAGAGQHLHFRSAAEDGGGVYEKREDPRELNGAYVFSSEETDRGKADDEIGYLNPRSSTVGALADIMRGEDPIK